jgi:hypothetical protein
MTSVSELKLLPKNYYTLSDNSKFVIKKGLHSGVVTLKPDSANFLADASTRVPTYALPLRIITADADTVLQRKSWAVIALKYENMLFGNYWHGGVTIEKNPAGTVVSTQAYYTSVNSPVNKAWSLTTIAPLELTANGYSDASPAGSQMKLTQNGGVISISSVTGAAFPIVQDGECTFNQSKLLQNRKIYLKYKYLKSNGNTCYATDTLTFRNRIRDGVPEWQDEKKSHYN